MTLSLGYEMPQSSILDYTSPASYCFWPADSNDKDAAAQQKGPEMEKAIERMKGWVGWGDKQKDNANAADTGDGFEGYGFEWKGKLPDMVPASGVERYMLAHIEDLQQAYDETHDNEAYGLNLGNISLTEYTLELLKTYKEYMLPPGTSPSHPPLAFMPLVLSRLSLRPPITPLPPRPNVVMTTDKSIDQMPWEFQRWKEIMPDWEIKYFDDKALDEWVNSMFGKSKVQTIWQGLPRQVLKSDIFRYMVMLIEGGVYTDRSAAAPVIHADQWGYPYENQTPPLLTHLYRLLSLSTSPHLPSSHPLSSFSPEHAYTTVDKEMEVDVPTGKSIIYNGPLVNDGAELGPPSLVVSVEFDSVEFGWDNWRDLGVSRAVQITQWTFMARPGHPVFLDALGRTLKNSEWMALKEKEAKANGQKFVPDNAASSFFLRNKRTHINASDSLNGLDQESCYTDCVYRYLLARYGFKPMDLLHVKKPTRVGDVLILPAGSYSSVNPFGDDQQREWAAVWHGPMAGRRPGAARRRALEEIEGGSRRGSEEGKRIRKPGRPRRSSKTNRDHEETNAAIGGGDPPSGVIGEIELSPVG
nr:glycosyltransferase [Cryptococcus depauperatus CBS 7841]